LGRHVTISEVLPFLASLALMTSAAGLRRGYLLGTAWNQGDKLDWDVSEQEFHKGLSSALGDVTDCAIAAVDAASGDATGDVILIDGGTLDITT
jgi:hypothetical protein